MFSVADKVGTGPGFPASADVWTASPAVSGIPASRGCAVALLRILVADIKVGLAFHCHLAGGFNISGICFPASAAAWPCCLPWATLGSQSALDC